MTQIKCTYPLFLLGVASQGLTAWYYFSRKKHLQAYRDQTPNWVLELERKQAGK